MTTATERTAIIDALRGAKHQIVFLQTLFCKDKETIGQQIAKVLKKINDALAVLRAEDTDDDD